MDLCDVNIWLALALSGHHHHESARAWLDAVEDPASVLFCRATQQAFLRLLTNSEILGAYGNPPLTNQQAWEAYEAFRADERIAFRADEPPGIEEAWKRFALKGSASPKLWMDAYLAAFALTAGYRLVTNDGAFRQFPGLDLLIPEGM